MAGFIAAKEFDSVDDAIKSMVHPQKEFMPNMENHKKYDYLFKNVYMKMYPSLKDIYKKVRSFNLIEK